MKENTGKYFQLLTMKKKSNHKITHQRMPASVSELLKTIIPAQCRANNHRLIQVFFRVLSFCTSRLARLLPKISENNQMQRL